MMNDELEGLLDEMDEFIRRAIDAETTSQTIEMLSGMTIEQVVEGFRDGTFEPKQELPVIPEYVAEWVVRYREKYDLYPALRLLENNTFVWGQIYEWYRMNTQKFVNAYLTGEYEVEEEHRYYVLFGSQLHDDNWTYALTKSGSIEFFEKDVLPEWDRTKLTEQEIRDYDERYIPFMVPVDEVNND